MLVDKLTSMGWQPTIAIRQFEKYPEDRYMMHGCRLENGQRINSFSKKATTMCHAIVLAALQACGNTKESYGI